MTIEQILLQTLIIAYGATGIVSIIAYWPTIKDLYYHQKPSANIPSYVLWTATGGIAFLYSVFILPDLLFIIVSGLGFLACLIVLLLSLGLKNRD